VNVAKTTKPGRRADGRDYPHVIVPPPGPKAKAIIARDERWTSTSNIKEYPLVVERGSGTMIEDVDGNRFLDFMAGIAVASTGHSHPKVVAAIQDAAAKFLHICGGDFYYEPMAALSERLAKLAPGKSKKRVFLTNSGTEAVEGAIKLARFSTKRSGIIAFKGAFHGRTMGALSLTSSKVKQHAGFGPFLPDVHHVPFAYCYRCEFGKTFPSCKLFCAHSIEQDLLSRQISPREVAAIFVEPVQGEGGYVVPPPGYLQELRDLCNRHGIMLVFDEIQSGIGRTGKMFAAEHFDVEPDILLSAKGLASGMPLGAIIAREKIMTWESGSHGSTFGGNPVCCAAALATLDVVEGGLVENAAVMGARLLAGAKRLMTRHKCIGDVRGLGLMIGMEFVKDRATREPAPELTRKVELGAFERGLLLLSCGKSTMRFAPALTIDAADVDEGLRILGEVLDDVAS
jgi:4-aminobutyrate aminotransferase